MGHAIYFSLYVLNFVLLQVFFIFKCFYIPISRKKCLIITIIYTIVFYSAEYITYGPSPAHMPIDMYITNSVIHAFNTFILIAIIAVYAEGYLPRNFIKMTFYYDILSLATSKFTFEFLQSKFITDDMNVSGSVFAAHTIDDIGYIVPYYLFLCILIITATLFNKTLTGFIEKIPDKICLIIFAIGFISFIATRISAAFMYTDIYGESAYKTGSLFFGSMILMTMLTIMLFVFIWYSRSKLEYQKIWSLENKLQFYYYNNIAQIDSDIHRLRHDLANHIAVARNIDCHSPNEKNRYITALHGICDSIDSRVDISTQWQALNTNRLSNREKYEIHRYINLIAEKNKINIHSITIKTEEYIEASVITAIFPKSPPGTTTLGKKIHPLFLKRGIPFKLMNTIAKIHHGSTTWIKGENSCNFYIHLH